MTDTKKTDVKLPEMFVEKRDPKKPWNAPKPDLSDENMAEQLQDAIIMNENAKTIEIKHFLHNEVRKKTKDIWWQQPTLDIIRESIMRYHWIEVTDEEIKGAVYDVFDMDWFDEVAYRVRDDMCSEFFNVALKYCLKQWYEHRDNWAWFIDWSWIGYLDVYLQDLKQALELTFDDKWYYKVMRPLEYALNKFWMDLTTIANWIHPWHYTYWQWHRTKSDQAVWTLQNKIFKIDLKWIKKLYISSTVFWHWRDWNLIHFKMDWYASTPNTTADYSELKK